MGKKRISVLGNEEETEQKVKKAVKLEQKKLREGKTSKPGNEKSEPVTPAVVLESAAPASQAAETEISSPEQPKTKSSSKNIHVRSSSYKKAKSLINSETVYPLAQGLELLKSVSLTKFDPTVELHITLKSGSFSQTVELPFSNGKTKRIAIADDTTIARIESGTLDFDVLLATPAQMAKLVKFAKLLGPKGLMPSPKAGTVVADPEATAKNMASTISVTLKTEKSASILHTVVGKLSQKPDQLTKNIQAIVGAIPATNLRKVVLKSTMSPAIKIQI